ncbi:MAG: ferredoxin [Candidatus Omnitrophota bacterium]
MKVTVIADDCIGCGLCADTCSAVYEMDDDKAKVLIDPVPSEQEDCAKKAADDCPVDAIKIT